MMSLRQKLRRNPKVLSSYLSISITYCCYHLGMVSSSSIFGRLISKSVSDETIVNKMSDALISSIKAQVVEMGIQLQILKRFQKSNFLVIEIKIIEIEILKLLHATKGPEFAENFTVLVDTLGKLNVSDENLPKIEKKIELNIFNSLMSKFSDQIPKKMEERGILTQVNCISSEDQAKFFFDVLDQL